MRILPIVLLAACGGANEHILEGTVYEKPSPTRIVVDHRDIPNFMPGMVMPFDVREASLLADVHPGDNIVARLLMADDGVFLEKIRVTGRGVIPSSYASVGTSAVLPGAALPTLALPLHDGSSWTFGPGQAEATALSFIYTRCPIPDFCPLTMSRLVGLQEALQGEARIVVITLDPDFDSFEVLGAYAQARGATTGEFMMSRLDTEAMAELAEAAGLSVDVPSGEVMHGLRLLITAADGTLIERYDDNRWDLDRVVSQLKTGQPAAPAGSEGTLTAPIEP